MRRRLEIARGLVHSPKILFLDEPTTGLDPVSRTNVWEMIEKLQGQSELTILLTTHYMDEADKLCQRIAIVDHGKLVALDTPTRLKDSVPGNEVVEAEFAGAPAGWHDALAALPGVSSVTEHEGATHISSQNGPETRGRGHGPGSRPGRAGAPRHRAEHHAGRRVFAFYRPSASR